MRSQDFGARVIVPGQGPKCPESEPSRTQHHRLSSFLLQLTTHTLHTTEKLTSATQHARRHTHVTANQFAGSRCTKTVFASAALAAFSTSFWMYQPQCDDIRIARKHGLRELGDGSQCGFRHILVGVTQPQGDAVGMLNQYRRFELGECKQSLAPDTARCFRHAQPTPVFESTCWLISNMWWSPRGWAVRAPFNSNSF